MAIYRKNKIVRSKMDFKIGFVNNRNNSPSDMNMGIVRI
jgi:hypothetical protein